MRLFKSNDENMKKKPDINLDDKSWKENPFILPDGYFSTLEDSVREKIKGESEVHTPLFSALKSGFALAFSFLLIFGMGYGVMHLTNTTPNNDTDFHRGDYFSYLIEKGYLREDFIDYLYHEIDFDSHEVKFEINEDLASEIEETLNHSEIIDYLDLHEYE